MIEVIDFNNQSVVLHYKLNGGRPGYYNLKMIDEKSNGVFYEEIIYIHSNVVHWTGCSFIKNYVYKNIIVRFELDNKTIFEKVYCVNEQPKESFLSKLNFKNQFVDITSYIEVFILKIYNQFGIFIEENDIVVDIGSNIGYSIQLAFENKCKEIYCCEPNPFCVEIIKENYGHNKNLYINQCAIDNFTGTSQLILPSKNSTSVSAKLIHDKTEIPHFILNVDTITFEDFISKNKISKIDFLKVDCEGNERVIFNTKNIEYIKENVNKIVVEYHDNKKDYIINLLSNADFEVHTSLTHNSIFAKNLNYKK